MRENLAFGPPALPNRCCLARLLALASCATRPPGRLSVPAGYCHPPLPYRYEPAFAPQANLAGALMPALLARYLRRNLLAAGLLLLDVGNFTEGLQQ